MAEQFWLICYDVRNEKRLRRVARVMEKYGARAQKSVFECWLDEKRLKTLQKEINAVINKEDSIRSYSLCATCLKTCEKEGNTPVHVVQSYYLV